MDKTRVLKIKHALASKILSFVFALSLIVAGFGVVSSQKVEAAINSPADYAFDYIYYADTYPDLKAAFGYNEAALRNHWLTYGINEGRSGSPVYSGQYYLSHNGDLIAAFGRNNYRAAYNHFLRYGYKEKRASSPYYNGNVYASRNRDLVHFDGNNLIAHYLRYGVYERRSAGDNVYRGDVANALNYSPSKKIQITPGVTVANGTYYLVSGLNGKSCLDISDGNTGNGANIHLWQKVNVNNQQIRVEHIGNGYYRLVANHSGKVVDINNGDICNGSNIKQWDWCDVLQQKWVIVNRGNGWFSIHSAKNTNYVIDVSGGNSGNGTNIWLYEYNGSAAQLFRFEGVSTNNTNNNNNVNSSSFQWPVSNSYVCGNNWSTYYSAKGKDHLGVDIKSSRGDSAIYAAGSGVVANTGWNSANGNTITIKHMISGKTVYSFYAHLSSINVSKGQTVSKGQKIGVIGNTGNSSTGTHLHFAFTTQCSTGTWGYGTRFSDGRNAAYYSGYTFYNPSYIISNGRLP